MIRVRFAPSPTGQLHLGNIRTALFNYLFAKHHAGKFILRFEDTDLERSKPEFRKAQVEDLLWMGLSPDEGPGFGGAFGPYLQSERTEIYKQSIKKLLNEGKAYECYVTGEEIEEMKRRARLEGGSLHFDNRGRSFSNEEIEKRKAKGIRPTVRFKIEKPLVKIHDLIWGDVDFPLEEMVGDFVIQRAEGTPTFHLAVCVDDAFMKITHVIRGEDHLSNTPKHLLLHEALGFEPPKFAHLPLVLGPKGETLSKRSDSVSVRAFRERGYLPEALANYIALLGWSSGDDREIFKSKELQEAFDLDRVGKSPSHYDPEKCDWLNGHHLRDLTDEEFARRAFAYLKERGLLKFEEERVRESLPVFKDKVERLDQLPEHLEILADDFSYEDESILRDPRSREVFQAALAILPSLRDGDDLYQTFVDRLRPQVKVKGKELFHPLRIALTGKNQGPELKRIIPVFGCDQIKRRLERVLQHQVEVQE